MCNSVEYEDRRYDTPEELAELLGGADKLVWQRTNPFVKWPEGEDWRRTDLCLCPVDLAATLTNAGFVWTKGDDPMEWHVRKCDAA